MSLRNLPVTGGHNLRDLGGYHAAGGRRVKWHTLYRSGTIYNLSPDDRAYMRQLGITAICDLRTPQECAHRPMDWHEGLNNVHYYGGVPLESGARLERLLISGDALKVQMRERMLNIYRRLPFEQADSYRHLFNRLNAGNVPLLFNCSAGKDRTGVAAALLLSALGVGRETIIEDYLLSNEAIEGLRIMMLERDSSFGAISGGEPDAMLPVLMADTSYLQAAFTEIERQYGDIDTYLHQHLGITPKIRVDLHALLLE